MTDKILVVDDMLVAEAREFYRLENFRNKDKLHYLRTAPVRNEPYDLTEKYQKDGGDRDIELLVLSEPKIRISSNDLFENSEGDEVIRKSFDLERAVSLIRSVDPDLLLVDLGFYCEVPPEFSDYYTEILEKKIKSRFRIKSEEVLDNNSMPWYFPLEDSVDSFLSNENSEYEPKLSEGGGVILGKKLKDLGIPFRFWTDDWGHGYENIQRAYTVDLLSERDVRSLVESLKFMPGVGSYGVSDSKSIVVGGKRLCNFGKSIDLAVLD